jgi:hypothetical protein
LLMANDPDLMALTALLAKAAVSLGALSTPLQEQVQRMNGSRVARTFQIRMIAPLATETERRLRADGVSAEAVRGFLVMGSALSADAFSDALADLEERYVGLDRDSRAQVSRRAALAVAMDFASDRVPTLTTEHLCALRRHWGATNGRNSDSEADPGLGHANKESERSPRRRPGPSA